MPSYRLRGLLLALGGLLLAATVQAQPDPLPSAVRAQAEQAELQRRIDAVDDQTRTMLDELRRLEVEAQRFAAYNDELAPIVARQAETLERREAALESAQATRESLPVVMRAMVERLDGWIEQDLPFLQQQRHARVASLETMLVDPELTTAERLERILSAWRTELAYGREMDTWRGMLDEQRKVDFLRLGRIGFYYLTPDGREGGVWLAERQQWQPLDEAARREVGDGLKMAREQRMPGFLQLPLSQGLEDDRHDGNEAEEGGA